MQYSNNTIGLGALEIIRILLVNQGMQSSFYKYRLWKLHLCKLFFRVFALKQLQGSNRSLIRFMEVVLVRNIPTSPFYTLLMSKK